MTKISVFLFALLVCAPLGAQESQADTETPQQTPEVTEPLGIPLTDVPKHADEVYQYLNRVEEKAEPLPEIIEFEKRLPAALDTLNTLQSDSLYQNLYSLSPRALQNLRQEWQLYLKKLDEWERILLDRSHELENEKKGLNALADLWKNTEKNISPEETPPVIQERILSTVEAIDSMRIRINERINNLLVLQNQVSKAQIQIKDLIDLINTTEENLRTRLFVKDSPPIWEAFSTKEDTAGVATHIRESWNNFSRNLNSFALANEDALYLHVVIFLVLLVLMVYFNRLNRSQKLFDEGEEVLRASAFFISRPISAALLIALFFSVWLYPDSTITIAEMMIVLFLLPLLRLVSGVVKPDRIKSVHVLTWLYVAVFIHNNIVGYPLLQRIMMLVIGLVTIGLFVWLLNLVRPLYKQELSPWPKFIFRILPVGIVMLITGIVANIIGSVNLANMITAGVIKTIMVAVLLFTIARVSDGLFILLIRKRVSRGFQFVKTYAEQMEKWAVFAIHLVAFLIWIRATLKSFHLFQPLQTWYRGLVETSWTFGTVVISVQNIVDFILTLVLAFVLSKLIRIILDMEVFPRVRLPRGIPGAISMVVRYTIVAVGILLALSSLGIDLGKFGLLAGALGVGLGFGLQNVIANFVSGLILAFERPIQVGDKVEVGNVLGNVKQIGVRSSTVKTFDGSEVIVPNADLISNQVINWTLTDARQRMKLPVKVAFDSEPEQVLDILLQVAREHPEVLSDPEPVATFNGFGDYFLDFTLYYWVTTNILKIKTEVAIRVHRDLREAGIEKPRPLQELNLHIVDAGEIVEIKKSKTSQQKSRKTRK